MHTLGLMGFYGSSMYVGGLSESGSAPHQNTNHGNGISVPT